MNKVLKKKFIFGGLVLVVVVYLAISLYVRHMVPGSVFPAEQIARSKTTVFDFPVDREFRLNGQGQKIEIVSKVKANTKEAVLYLHGNSGRLPYIINDASLFGSVVAPAYPGYAGSEGKPTESGVYETVDVAMNYLQEKGYAPGDVTVLGHSLGGAAAVYAAEYYPVKKLILVNTFNNVFLPCFEKYNILCVFTYNIFNSGQRAEQVTVPVRQFHDREDTVIPFTEAEKLFSHFPGPDAVFSEHGGVHNQFDVAGVLSKK